MRTSPGSQWPAPGNGSGCERTGARGGGWPECAEKQAGPSKFPSTPRAPRLHPQPVPWSCQDPQEKSGTNQRCYSNLFPNADKLTSSLSSYRLMRFQMATAGVPKGASVSKAPATPTRQLPPLGAAVLSTEAPAHRVLAGKVANLWLGGKGRASQVLEPGGRAGRLPGVRATPGPG